MDTALNNAEVVAMLFRDGFGDIGHYPNDGIVEPISDEMIGRISRAVWAADEAFWTVVERHFPEIGSGDFDPQATINREQHNLDDVQSWVEGNTPEAASEVEGTEYVVDVLVPIAITVRAEDEEMAASMALESLENEGVRARIQALVDSDDSSFTISDSPAQTEVGEA